MLEIIISAILFFGSIIGLIILIISKTISKRKKKKNNEEKNEITKTDKKTKELIPFSYYDLENECFIYLDQSIGCSDIYKFISRDTTAMSQNNVQLLMYKMEKFYKLYEDDVKIIGMNFPSNTQKQQKLFKDKLEKTKNAIKRKWIQIQIDELQAIEKSNSTREFFLMIFALNSNDLYQKREKLSSILGIGSNGMVSTIPKEIKYDVWYKINNKNSIIYAEGRE